MNSVNNICIYVVGRLSKSLVSTFVLNCLFKDICMANSFDDRNSVSLWDKGQSADFLLFRIIKNVSF